MKFLKNAVFRVVDVETTGTDGGAAVVELAYADMRMVGNKPLLMDQFSTLVDPGIPIPPEASAIHHITDEQVSGKPDIVSVMFQTVPTSFDDQVVLVAHNAEFDSRFVTGWPHPWLCTMRMAKRLLDEATTKSYSNQYLRYLLHIQPLHTGPLSGGAHRAAYDVAVTAGLLAHLLGVLAESYNGESLGDFLDAMALPIRQVICHFGNKHKGEKWKDVPTSYLDWMRKNVTDLDQDTKFTLECEWRERMGIRS